MAGSSSLISAAPVVTSEVPSTSSPARPAPSSENSRQSGKRNIEIDGKEGVFCTPVPHPVECINIGFRRDELDPTVLGKLPVPAAIAAASAQKKSELQLRSCQDMVHTKDKELTEALNELSRALDLLAKLGVPGYADPKSPTGT
ncbi:hypothetical protein Fot_11347 [Forsythia ovata]|uniref:Uncharacterized protein n=1 Tax=Forsythia ovata TaxID=205694 RepID=A0ABD1WJN6_9LAMI